MLVPYTPSPDPMVKVRESEMAKEMAKASEMVRVMGIWMGSDWATSKQVVSSPASHTVGLFEYEIQYNLHT